ncbi:RNA-binding protein YhbY [Sinobacterium norvegicum]|uniref:RNA-binding protein YhbY n=1 Tax=Sinobacterium norvegicum TaxID=1641715 RepID=A0ABM9AGH0_9GAMM|nr:ribosome assembly RNA-binding protein YhbY [Sinobacterium norvegicum]CAH0992232.1 RNA-binding protein YhbY [Sinobacterium norvegicum]
MSLSNSDKKHLRALGHKLKPIVTVAGKGLTDNVVTEIYRALDDHELIKVKLAVGEREVKQQVIEEMLAKTRAHLVQAIGHTVLLYRPAKKPNPKLSNLSPANS